MDGLLRPFFVRSFLHPLVLSSYIPSCACRQSTSRGAHPLRHPSAVLRGTGVGSLMGSCPAELLCLIEVLECFFFSSVGAIMAKAWLRKCFGIVLKPQGRTSLQFRVLLTFGV